MEKNRIRSKRWKAWMLIIFLVIGIMPMQAHAIEKIDEDANVSMTIDFQSEEGPMAGVAFRIYKAADMEGYGELLLNEQFANYPVAFAASIDEFEDAESSEWKKIAQTWATYAQLDELEPIDTGITDSNGQITFPEGTAKMTPGLYLVVGESFETEENMYTATGIL